MLKPSSGLLPRVDARWIQFLKYPIRAADEPLRDWRRLGDLSARSATHAVRICAREPVEIQGRLGSLLVAVETQYGGPGSTTGSTGTGFVSG